MLACLLVVVAPAQLRHASSFHSEAKCPSGLLPRGMMIDFSRTEELANNLGGYPNGKCAVGASEEPVDDGEQCPCGCGCRCVNHETDTSLPKVLRYNRAIHIYDGTSTEPSEELDLVVANMTEYVAWNSGGNGIGSEGTYFAINMLQNTTTTFEISFVKPGTEQKKAVPFGARRLLPCRKAHPSALSSHPCTMHRL